MARRQNENTVEQVFITLESGDEFIFDLYKDDSIVVTKSRKREVKDEAILQKYILHCFSSDERFSSIAEFKQAKLRTFDIKKVIEGIKLK